MRIVLFSFLFSQILYSYCIKSDMLNINNNSNQILVVHSVIGHVLFSVDNKEIIVKDFMQFSDEKGFFIFKTNDSEILYRIGNDYKVLKANQLDEKHSLKDLFINNSTNESIEESTFNKFINIFLVKDEQSKINKKMALSTRSGVDRDFSNTYTILLEDVEILYHFPFKIEFSKFFSHTSNEKTEYNIVIKNKFSAKLISTFKTSKPFFIFDTKEIDKPLFLIWDVQISTNESDENINFSIIEKSQKELNKIDIDKLNELKGKIDLGSNLEQTYDQILFVEALLSNGLIANATYFLDSFIIINNDPFLVTYKNHYMRK